MAYLGAAVLGALVLAACSGGPAGLVLARQVSGQPPPPCSANPPLGMDQPDATMPALTGHRDSDWTAFAAVYGKVTNQLPASPAQRQELGAATMTTMVASLDNNHARWSYPAPPSGIVPGDLGIMTSPAPPLAQIAPQAALPPLFITAVLPGSPAASAGLRPGDIIVSVNGTPPFTGGIVPAGVMNLLSGQDRRQLDHPPGHARTQRRPRAHQRHRRRPGLRRPAHRTGPVRLRS